MHGPDWLLILAIALSLLAAAAGEAARSPRLHERFDDGWRFHRGDAPEAWQPSFDDAAWRRVDLPHDWSVEDLPPAEDTAAPQCSGPFDPQAEGAGAVGFTLGGVGWYRKAFALPEALRGRRITLSFDGVYMDAEVWLNGERLGEHPYGYTSFAFDVTPHARFGGEANVLAVKVDASGKTSRWYPGSGIYRHAWLTATEAVHVPPWGVFVTTPRAEAEAATVLVRTQAQNDGAEGRAVTVEQRVLDAAGKTVASARGEVRAEAGAEGHLVQEMQVERPALWSPDSPALYRLVTTLSVAGRPVDEVGTTFGIRRFTVDAEHGLVLNGRPLKLLGGCVHHDNGCLGSRTYDRAEERRVEMLKAAGFNAIRTAHNPPSPGFLDACDRLGMVVIDEAFDCWHSGKNPQDYGRFFEDWWQRDIESMVRRDRNHPSVFFWSIGNEIPEQGSQEGADRAALLVAHVRSFDPTRPVTIAAHPGTSAADLDPIFAQVDVCGYNYMWDRYSSDHERKPERVIFGTESFPGACFDTLVATQDMPWVIGDFVWTSLDYLGESAIGHTYFEGEANEFQTWPWTSANCGDLDLCCWQRPPAYYRRIVWGGKPEVCCFVQRPLPPGKAGEHIHGWGWPDERPSWTWPGEEGKPLTVRVYSSCPRVRLLLNGRDVGDKETSRASRFTATYVVPYEVGELVAVGLDAEGREVGRWELKTAGPPAALRVKADRATIHADNQDLSFVTAEVVDAAGVLDPNAGNLVRFHLDGPGAIIAVGNGDPHSVESFQQLHRKAFRGRCLVVVKASHEAGQIRLQAKADGLTPADVTITGR